MKERHLLLQAMWREVECFYSPSAVCVRSLCSAIATATQVCTLLVDKIPCNTFGTSEGDIRQFRCFLHLSYRFSMLAMIFITDMIENSAGKTP